MHNEYSCMYCVILMCLCKNSEVDTMHWWCLSPTAVPNNVDDTEQKNKKENKNKKKFQQTNICTHKYIHVVIGMEKETLFYNDVRIEQLMQLCTHRWNGKWNSNSGFKITNGKCLVLFLAWLKDERLSIGLHILQQSHLKPVHPLMVLIQMKENKTHNVDQLRPIVAHIHSVLFVFAMHLIS